LSKKEIISVKDASFDMPYSSVFSGSPLITVGMKRPEINLIKGADGKLNVMSLMKPSVLTGASSSKASGVGSENAGARVELPAMVLNAHFGIGIESAKIIYKDQSIALTNTIDSLNLRVKDFSLSRKTELELWADLKTQMGADTKLEGPLRLLADLSPQVSDGEVKSATVNATFSADDLSIEKGSLFIKKKGVPANFKFAGTLDQASLKLKEASARFHNAEITLAGSFQKDSGLDFRYEAKPVELKPWSELVPMLKEYELEGKLGLKGTLKGKPESLQYQARLLIESLAAKGPNLKARPVINGSIEIATDKIERFRIDLKGPGNEITLDGKMISFSKPMINFTLTSPKGLDLDQWIEFPKTDSKAAGKAGAGVEKGASGAASGKGSDSDLDAMLEPIRKNEMLKSTSIEGTVSIAFIKAMGVRVDDLAGKVQFKNLVAAFTGLRMKMYDGLMSGTFSTDLKPKEPLYNMNFSVSGFDIQKAVESEFKAFKDTVLGRLSASIQGGGASFNSDVAKRKLQMKGDFKVINASFKTIDIARMANDAINGSLGKIADKVPVLKGKNLRVNSNAGSKYDLISSSFTISNGVMDAPNFVAKASPKNGIDLKGSIKMGLIDQSLDARWELTDTYHVTGADQLSVNIAGKEIKNFLAKNEKDAVVIPFTVGCKWSTPCPNYSQVPEYLAGVAAGRLKNIATDVVKEKVKDAAKGALQNGLKGLFGR
jgi:uncharacterized protein involved in outer membrane biogenesis